MTDRYQIISLIEKDQLGSVYLAQDTTLQRKVIFRSFDEAEEGHRPAGFSKYTGKLCALQHPNLLTIYDIATNDDGYFMVTQFLEGESLEDRLAQGALSQVGVHNMACDLLDALHAAHSSGLYHGAMRTDSIIRLPRVRGGHRYLIVDFGQDRLSTMLCGSPVVMADPVLTAPELVGRRTVPDSSSDLFTLGQLCYIALVGGHPYAGKTAEECAHAYREGGLPHLNTYVQGVQDDFADWVMSLVAGSPDQRAFSSQEAMTALHAIRIKAPSPNVPGVTEAVDVPPPHNPHLPKISEPVRVSSEPSFKSGKSAKSTKSSKPAKAGKSTKSTKSTKPATPTRLGKEKPKDKKMLYIAVGVVVGLLAVLVLILLLRVDGSKTSDTKSGSSVPEKPMALLQEPKHINQLLTSTTPVNIALESGKTLDWTVVTGSPASRARVKKAGGHYFKNVLAIGEFREFIDKKKMITYSIPGRVIAPQRCVTNSKKGGAKQGEGWDIHIVVPENHKGPLLLTLFVIQNQCDFNLEVRSTNKVNAGKILKLNIAKAYSGVAKIPLKITDPAPGYYSFRVLAGSDQDESGFEMGLSAVLLERL